MMPCIWSLYLIAMELSGPSGLHAYLPRCLTSAVLWPMRCELVLSVHDMHHRYGRRHSFNYGKQLSLWDVLSGTMYGRLEGYNANVDWTASVVP